MYLSKIKVKEVMNDKGIMTFTDLANQLGITKYQLSVMLSDGYNPLKAGVEKLCNLLEVNPGSIIEFSDSKNLNLENNVNNDDVTAIELFAGAGGIALGLEEAGIKTLQYVEIDKACCETLKTNRPDWNIVCKDVSAVDFKMYKDKVDIVTRCV